MHLENCIGDNITLYSFELDEKRIILGNSELDGRGREPLMHFHFMN